MTTEERCPECSGFRGLPRMIFSDEDPRECTNEFHKTPAPVLEFPSPESKPVEPVTVGAPKHKPLCPHCGCEGKILGSTTILGPIKVMAVYCEECHKYLGFFQPLQLEVLPGTPGVH